MHALNNLKHHLFLLMHLCFFIAVDTVIVLMSRTVLTWILTSSCLRFSIIWVNLMTHYHMPLELVPCLMSPRILIMFIHYLVSPFSISIYFYEKLLLLLGVESNMDERLVKLQNRLGFLVWRYLSYI